MNRLRALHGMSREQALLQEAGVALDGRASAVNRALAEHRVIQQRLQGTFCSFSQEMCRCRAAQQGEKQIQ